MDYLAIDIGGTYIKYAFIDNQRKLYGHQKIKTKENIDDAILRQVQAIIASVTQRTSINGVGISTAGIVDREQGKIIYAGPTIKNYRGTQFKERLTEIFNLPIHVENDVNAALLGECWLGAAQDENQVFCVTLGTGIGGAYYLNGIIDGFHHQANSIGYLLYESATKTNYEMRASTAALTKNIQNEFGKTVSVERVFEKAKGGDERCLSIIEEWCMEVAKGLAQIILMIDPKCLLIGGGISQQGDFLLQHIKKQIPIFLPEQFFKTTIKMAQLYNDAALFGAIYPFYKEENNRA